MRLLCLIIVSLVLTSSVLAEAKMPSRKAGLWEISIVAQGPGGSQSAKHCIDAATDEKMQQMASSMGQACSRMETRQEGPKFISEAVCTMMGTKVTSRAVFSGNFDSSYEGNVQATYDPPLMGMKDSKTKISARWVGPCEAGQKPGDIIMGNGMKLNVNQMQWPSIR